MPEAKSTQLQPNFRPGHGRMGQPMEKAVLKDVRGTLRRLLRYLAGFRRMIGAAFLCAVASTLVTIVGTRLNGYTVDHYIALREVQLLLRVCVLMAGMYLIGALAGYAQNLLMIRVSQRTAAHIRSDLFEKVERLPLAYFETHSSGDLMSRLTNDVDNINTAISQTVVQFFTSIVSVAGMLAAMLLLSPALTLVCLVTTPVTFLLTRLIARHAQRYFKGQQEDLGEMNGYIEEMISGQKVLGLFGQEARVVNRFGSINRRYVRNAFRAQAASGIIGPCNNMVNNIAYLLVAVAGGLCVIHDVGGITVGVVFSFLLYMRNFTNPINNILSLVNALQLAIASAERVFETMDEPPEADGPDAVDIDHIDGDIRLDHVDFSYVPGEPVLRDASLYATPGQTVAIVGPTGAGKTTIVSLLTRFYDFQSGSITIDGRPIEEFKRHSLRQSISLVLQDTFLFSDTIRENIRYGRIDATDEAVEAAARQARAHGFIMQLPKGYDTILEDNGENLSQGQRQLLNIARGIVAQSSVLILDEATSSVDTRTERLIQDALLALMRSKTSFIIAHRLSTIQNADVIVVIDQGRVIEKGTHAELLAMGGFYARLYESQFKKSTPVTA